jgi:hypothetical protein
MTFDAASNTWTIVVPSLSMGVRYQYLAAGAGGPQNARPLTSYKLQIHSGHAQGSIARAHTHTCVCVCVCVYVCTCVCVCVCVCVYTYV